MAFEGDGEHALSGGGVFAFELPGFDVVLQQIEGAFVAGIVEVDAYLQAVTSYTPTRARHPNRSGVEVGGFEGAVVFDCVDLQHVAAVGSHPGALEHFPRNHVGGQFVGGFGRFFREQRRTVKSEEKDSEGEKAHGGGVVLREI